MSSESNRPVDWEALVSQNENRLYRAALSLLGDPQEAEDAVQDAFVRYLERAPEELENPGAWLMRVLVNNCKSRLRLAWRRVGSLPDTLPAPAVEEREVLEELFALPPADRRKASAPLPPPWPRRTTIPGHAHGRLAAAPRRHLPSDRGRRLPGARRGRRRTGRPRLPA